MALALAATILLRTAAESHGQTAHIQANFAEPLGPMNMGRMALGQGGLSNEPMWADRVAEVRALRPKLVRLFIQEYFDLLPRPGVYHFESLDRSVDTIVSAGAQPLMCICFKPQTLFPQANQDIVEPADYGGWESLIYELVKHYRDRNTGIRFWEIGNEPDIGEDGGCPYRFKPESYVRYYQHTTAAILRADPEARVGGPALASSRSAILPALLEFCQTNRVPLHFVSWHIYGSDPQAIGATVKFARTLISQFPGLNPETILDEWNMDLTNPPLDARFQPCFVCESIWQMKEAGLDYSCYYHIRDCYVNQDQFKPFMSEKGAAFMARWWNRMPQFDGLFDYQNQVRPAYYAFKLLSRLAGERLSVEADHPAVHCFASHDASLRCDNLVLWNFSKSAVKTELTLKGLQKGGRFRHVVLDALSADADENSRLRPDPFGRLEQANPRWEVTLEPYAVHYWYFE